MSGMSNSNVRKLKRRKAVLGRLEANLVGYRNKTFHPTIDDDQRKKQVERVEGEIAIVQERIKRGAN